MYNGKWEVMSFGKSHGIFRIGKDAEGYCEKTFGKDWYQEGGDSKAMIIRREQNMDMAKQE